MSLESFNDRSRVGRGIEEKTVDGRDPILGDRDDQCGHIDVIDRERIIRGNKGVKAFVHLVHAIDVLFNIIAGFHTHRDKLLKPVNTSTRRMVLMS